MNRDRAEDILRLLGCQRIKFRPNGWVVGSCPFAPFKHQNGNDLLASFGIKVNEQGSSHYNCYTCQSSGDMINLMNALRWKYNTIGVDLGALAKLIANDDLEATSSIKTRIAKAAFLPKPVEIAGIKLSSNTATKYGLQDTKSQALPEETLKPFEKFHINAYKYLTGWKRKFTAETIKEWGLGWFPKEQRIIIPIRDCQKRLVGYSRRLLEDEWVLDSTRGKYLPFVSTETKKAPPKYLHSEGFKRDLVLYGEDKIDLNTRTGILVEGFFDVVYLWQLGYPNAVAIMGTHLSPLQEHKILKFFDKLVYFRDGDEAGLNSAQKVQKRLEQKVPVVITETPEAADPNSLSPENVSAILGF